MAAEPEHAFQYTLLRVVPSLPRGEALNVGVVLYCRRLGFLAARTQLDRERLHALDPELDLEQLARHLQGVERVAAGDPAAGAIAALDRSERFGSLSAPASSLIQPSPVHTGLCADAEETLERLFAELVASPD
ncbi:MAG TPA: DUF3037 domain-containing protein [Thermoleophilaceae bacterium]